jgi:hypothetical protein
MNPFSLSKCAYCTLAVLALAGILLLAACGNSGGLPQTLGGNYSNSSLKGHYVISQTGIGVNQAGTAVDPFSETIVFTADGNGGLNVKVDDFDQVGGPFGLTGPVTGTYGVNKDGTGFLAFSGFNYAITMIDDSHFYIIEQDTFSTASGFGELQDSTAPPAGNFVFKAHEVSISSRVGFMAIAGGAINGTEDFLGLGLTSTTNPVASTVSMTTPDANGKGTFSLADTTTFNYYVVNANKFYIMSNNAVSGSLEIGQGEAQTGGPFSPATLANGDAFVFGSAGDTGFPAGIHSAGVFSTDGAGHVTAGGAVDFVQDTTVNSNLTVSGGGYTLAGNGRGTLNLTLSGGAISPQVFWMVSPSRAYFLADSSAAVEDGTFILQQGAPFSAVGAQAAFVMDGFDVAFKDRVGAFEPTTGNFNWNQAANSFDPVAGGNPSTVTTNGTFQVSSNGRVAVTVNGVTSSLVFYLSSASSGVMVQEDADIGGAFTVQAGQ